MICAKPFKSADKNVCYHNYLTGKYRGPAHNEYNLNYRIDQKKVKITYIIRNISGIIFLCYSYFHYFYGFRDSDCDSYFLFYSTNFVNPILQLFCMFSANQGFMQCWHFFYFLHSCYISFIVFRIRRWPYTVSCKTTS